MSLLLANFALGPGSSYSSLLNSDVCLATTPALFQALYPSGLLRLYAILNTSVEERVNASIETGIACIAQQYCQADQANTTATTDLKAQVADLKSTVAQLPSQLSSLSSDISARDGDSAKTDTRRTQPREYGQKEPQEERITWKTGLLWDNNWRRNK